MDLHGTRIIGSKSFHAKLTEEQVEQIRQEYIAGATQLGLARVYGISKSSIGRVIRGDQWCRVPGPISAREMNKLRVRGSQHGQSKLDESAVLEIRRLHALSPKPTQRELAQLFQVDPMTIYNVTQRKTWAWL